MATPSTAVFLDAIRLHQLLEPEHLNELAGLRHRFADAKGLARELIQRGWLTPYQANQLLAGKAQELVLGSYVLLERIGEGGMGAVYKARHVKLGRVVALKVIRKERLSNSQAVRRFHREIRAAAQLNHPNIVLAFDADEHNGTHFFAMEFVSGLDLGKLVQSQGPLPIDLAGEFLRQAALGLQHAYESGLVHRDIKPSNLLVSHVAKPAGAAAGDSGKKAGATPSGVTLQSTVKVLDLGLARVADNAEESGSMLTQEGTVMGTPDYLAPEQALDSHTADVRADLYSLGCTFYYALTGKVPFPGGTMTEKLLKHQMQEPTPLEQLRQEIPPRLAAVIRKLMAKRPADRFQTPAEVAAALAAGTPGRAGAAAVTPHPVTRQPHYPTPTPVATATPPPQPAPAAGASDYDPFGSVMLGGKTEEVRAAPSTSRRLRPAPARQRLSRPLVIGGGVGVLALVLVATILFFRSGKSDRPGDPGKGRVDAKVTLTIAGGKPWQDTGVDIEAGKQVVIAARGQWGKQGQQLCTASGLPDMPRDRAVLPAAPALCLLGRIGRAAQPFPVGSLASITPPQSGRLFLQANDLDTDSDVGDLHIEISGSCQKGDPAASPEPCRVERAEAELKALAGRMGEQARPDLLAFLGKFPGTFQAARAADLLAQLPSPADRLDPASIPEKAQRPGLPDETVAVFGSATWRHGHNVPCVAVSPDGTLVASGGSDRLVILWEYPSGKRLAVLSGHTNNVRCLAFAPDGKTLASGDDNGNVKTWEVATGKRLLAFHAHPGWVRGMVFSLDGTRLATGGNHKGAQLKLWDLQTETTIYAREADSEQIVGLALSPDGKTLASAGLDAVKLWDFATGQEKAVLAGHVGHSHSVSFSPDGSTLASAGYGDSTVRLWDVAAAREKAVLQGHGGSVFSVAFSPDGKTLASAGGDWTIRLWDPAAGKELMVQRGHLAGVFMVAFAPDGRTLVSGGGDGGVRLWDTAIFRERAALTGHEGWVHGLAIAPDGQTLVSTSVDDSVVKVWDLAGKKEPLTLRLHTGAVYGAAFAPDGLTFATASNDQTIKIWDTASGQVRTTLTGHTDGVFMVAYSPDGKYLASTGRDQTVRLWEVATGNVLAALDGHSAPIYGLAFSPDGKTLATGSGDQTVRLWDVAARQERAILRGHRNLVAAVAFAPDGKTLASAGYDNVIRLWDPESGRVRALLRVLSGTPGSVAFSPDSKTLAAGLNNGRACVWDLATQQARETPALQSGHARAVAFTPDGKTLAVASQDRTVRLWDVPPSRQWPSIEGPRFELRSVAVSPDGTLLAAGDQAGVIWLWELGTGKLHSVLPGNSGPVQSLAFLPDGKTLAAGMDGNDNAVRLWDITTGLELASSEPGNLEGLAVSADGQTLAVGTNGGPRILEASRLADHTPLNRSHNDAVPFIGLSPTGDIVAAGAPDRTAVDLWHVQTGEGRGTLRLAGTFYAAAFSPDGQTIATGHGSSNGIQLWDADDGKQRAFLARPGGVTEVRWAANSKSLVLREGDYWVTLLGVAAPDQARTWKLVGVIRAVASCPDGRHLAVANYDGTVHVLRVGAVPK